MANPNTTAHWSIGALLALAVGLSGWTLLSVQSLGKVAAVQSNEIGHLKQNISTLRGDLYLKDSARRLELQVADLEERMKRFWTVLNKIRGQPTGEPDP